MKNAIWEELTEEELYNAVLDDYSKYIKTDGDFIMWARKIVENMCLMMTKVTNFINYLNPKNAPKIAIPGNDYDLKSINKVWQKEAKTVLGEVWLPN